MIPTAPRDRNRQNLLDSAFGFLIAKKKRQRDIPEIYRRQRQQRYRERRREIQKAGRQRQGETDSAV